MATTINQPSPQPTNKLTAATAGSAAWSMIMSIAGLTLKNLYPEWYDPEVLLQTTLAVPTIIVFGSGWLTRDRPNVKLVITDETTVE